MFLYTSLFPKNSNISGFRTTTSHLFIQRSLTDMSQAVWSTPIKLTADIVTLHCLGHVVPAGRGVKVASAVGLQLRKASLLFPRPSAVADLPGDTMQLSWVCSLGSEHPWEAGWEITYRLKIPTLPHQIRQREGMEPSGVDIGPLGGGEGRTPSSISKETLKCCHLHTGSVVSPVVLMAERALEEDVAQERREMGGKSVRTQRWTQPCVKQATHREPKKWVSEGRSGLRSKGFKMFGYKE